MKKIMALVLTAALMAMPVSPAVALADTTSKTSSPESVALPTTTETDETAVEGEIPAEQETTVNDESSVNEESPVLDSDDKEVKSGILPDSPLYWLDGLVEKLQVALAFNPEKKIKIIEKQACERLAEILALAKKADAEQTASESTDAAESTDSTETTEATESAESLTENTERVDEISNDASEPEEVEKTVADPKVEKKFKHYEKALKGYDTKIAHAQEFLTKIQDTNSEEYQKLQVALAKVNANNVLVLGSLLEKLPPHASQRLAVNIVRSMEKAVEKMEKMEEKNKELVDEENTQEEDSQEERTEGSVEDTDGDREVTTPAPAKTVVPVAPVPNTAKKDGKHQEELAEKEYKELAKEAKSVLKEFKRDLGLIGPDKAKSKDNDKKSTPQPQKVNNQLENNINGKHLDKSSSDEKEVRISDKDNKGKKDHGRDDDRGKGKGNRD